MNDAAMLAALIGQTRKYRLAFLEIMRAAGEDLSEVDDPDQIVHPLIEDLALASVKQLRDDYNECMTEMVQERNVTCPSCDPIGAQGRGCPFCRPERFANTETYTGNTPLLSTNTDDVLPAAILQQTGTGTSGVPDEYVEILTDIVALLNGDMIDCSGFVHLAAQAIEYELADRMLEALQDEGANVIH